MQSGLLCSFAAAVQPSGPPSNAPSIATETVVAADAPPTASASSAAPDTHPSRQARRMRLLSAVDTILLPWLSCCSALLFVAALGARQIRTRFLDAWSKLSVQWQVGPPPHRSEAG
jgi:hypothetical protein